MQIGTLCLIIDERRILLGMKKTGFGAGRWNAFGGKIRDGETPETAALRELDEEAGIHAAVESLGRVAVITFHFSGQPEWQVYVFRAASWSGEPHETKEMRPEWHDLDRIPYGEMWEADRRWLPLVLSGKRITADAFYRDRANHVLDDFRWQEASDVPLPGGRVSR